MGRVIFFVVGVKPNIMVARRLSPPSYVHHSVSVLEFLLYAYIYTARAAHTIHSSAQTQGVHRLRGAALRRFWRRGHWRLGEVLDLFLQEVEKEEMDR